MTQLPEEAIEAVGAALVKNLKCGTSVYVLAEAAATAAYPSIEKAIREQVAADIWEYWDACGDLIDDRDSARQAIDAIAAQIAKGADNA